MATALQLIQLMKRIFFLMLFLTLGLVLSQLAPLVWGDYPGWFSWLRQFMTMGFLAYIMIEVGREFQIDLSNKKQYAVDYFVAATAAGFPWIMVSLYFLVFLMPEIQSSDRPQWMDALLAGRFAAPTSAGILFSMLAAAGLSRTWVFRKTRILAIFDDLDTVLLMIPLQILMVGMVWQLGGVLAAIIAILIFGYKFYKRLKWPASWVHVLAYAFLLTAITEVIYYFSKDASSGVGLHIEVLLPAFVLGCALRSEPHAKVTLPGEDAPGHQPEELAGVIVSCVFVFLVGFSMPNINGMGAGGMSFWVIAFHVLVVTLLSNIGKMFACFCYKNEASFKERLAVSVALFPRGEVGAGVLALALGYGMSGPFIIVAFLSLSLNLLLTGVFIFAVKKILRHVKDTVHYDLRRGAHV